MRPTYSSFRVHPLVKVKLLIHFDVMDVRKVRDLIFNGQSNAEVLSG